MQLDARGKYKVVYYANDKQQNTETEKRYSIQYNCISCEQIIIRKDGIGLFFGICGGILAVILIWCGIL